MLEASISAATTTVALAYHDSASVNPILNQLNSLESQIDHIPIDAKEKMESGIKRLKYMYEKDLANQRYANLHSTPEFNKEEWIEEAKQLNGKVS